MAKPTPPHEPNPISALVVSKSKSISLISPVTAAFVAKIAETDVTGASVEYSIAPSTTPYQYVVELSKSLDGSMVILFLSLLIIAVKATSVPFESPTFKETLEVKSVISESSKFLKKSFVEISKFVDMVESVSPLAGEYC